MTHRAARGLQWGAAGITAALLLGSLGRHHWMLDLLSHWRVQYAVGLVGCAAGLALLRRPLSAALVLLVGILVAGTVVAQTGWPAVAAATTATTATTAPAVPGFRFATFNLHARNTQVQAIGEWLERSGADVVALNEVGSAQALQRLAAALPSYPHVQAQFGRHADVVFFSRWPVLHAQGIELTRGGARALKVRIDWSGQPVTLVGVHLPWPLGAHNVRHRDGGLQALAALARDTPGPLLVGGDFNLTPWSPVFRAALQASPLTDCALGQGLLSSWPTFFAPAGIRIDHCLASAHWRVQQVAAGPALGSDHRPMLNRLELTR